MRGKGRWLAAFFCLSVLCMTPLLSGFVINLAKIQKKPVLAENMEKFRQMEVAAERLKGYREWGEKEYFQLAREYLYYDGKIKKHCKKVSSFSWYSVLMPDGMIRMEKNPFIMRIPGEILGIMVAGAFMRVQTS